MKGSEPASGILRGLVALRQGMTRGLEIVVILAVAALTLDVLWGVFSRYILSEQSRWTEELARVLLIWVALLGTSVAFGVKGHLGVDFFVGLMDRGAQRIMRVVANLVVLWFALSVMVWGGGVLVRDTFQLEQMMMTLGIPKGAVYLALPISGLFISLYCIEALVETLLGRDDVLPEAEPSTVED